MIQESIWSESSSACFNLSTNYADVLLLCIRLDMFNGFETLDCWKENFLSSYFLLHIDFVKLPIITSGNKFKRNVIEMQNKFSLWYDWL